MRRRMILVVGVQVLFGLTMAVFGLLKFIKPDIKVQDDVTLQSFIDTGWLWQLVGAAELVGGLAVASGLLVPLGLIVLTPVVLGIAAFAFKTGGDEASVVAKFRVRVQGQMRAVNGEVVFEQALEELAATTGPRMAWPPEQSVMHKQQIRPRGGGELHRG